MSSFRPALTNKKGQAGCFAVFVEYFDLCIDPIVLI